MELESSQWIFFIALQNFLYVTNIPDTLKYIINHSCQPDCLFVIDNVATTVRYTTFILLVKDNKGITLDADLPFKERHSQPDHTNLPNDFKNTTVRLIHDKSSIPTRSTEYYDAYDLHSLEQVSIKPGETKKINTGVNIHLPQDSFGFVTSQSSIATRHELMVPTGTIYHDYTRKISVVLHNQSKTTFSIKEGMRIAQILILQVSTITLHTTQSKRVTSRGKVTLAAHTRIAAPLSHQLFIFS